MVLTHVVANVASPVIVIGTLSLLMAKPAWLDFALCTVAPWTALASTAIAISWYTGGRKGVFAVPPAVMQHVLPNTFIFTVLFAIASLIFKSLRTDEIACEGALDGGISAFLAGLMSGLAIVRQAVAASSMGTY
jgi:hypothetical protein